MHQPKESDLKRLGLLSLGVISLVEGTNFLGPVAKVFSDCRTVPDVFKVFSALEEMTRTGLIVHSTVGFGGIAVGALCLLVAFRDGRRTAKKSATKSLNSSPTAHSRQPSSHLRPRAQKEKPNDTLLGRSMRWARKIAQRILDDGRVL
jgi:hypothetical protein